MVTSLCAVLGPSCKVAVSLVGSKLVHSTNLAV